MMARYAVDAQGNVVDERDPAAAFIVVDDSPEPPITKRAKTRTEDKRDRTISEDKGA